MAEFPKYTLVYLGKVNRFDRKQQLNYYHQIVDKFRLAPFGKRIYEHNEIDEFIESMRSSEVALIPFLDGLASKKGTGVGIQFFINLMKVQSDAGLVIALDTTKPRAIANLITARSDAGKDWYTLVEKTAWSVMRGRNLKKRKRNR